MKTQPHTTLSSIHVYAEQRRAEQSKAKQTHKAISTKYEK